jgi:hypothetical protein
LTDIGTWNEIWSLILHPLPMFRNVFSLKSQDIPPLNKCEVDGSVGVEFDLIDVEGIADPFCIASRDDGPFKNHLPTDIDLMLIPR